MSHDFRRHLGRFLIVAAVVYPLWYIATSDDGGVGFIPAFILGAVLMVAVIWSDLT